MGSDEGVAWALIIMTMLTVAVGFVNRIGETFWPTDDWAPTDYIEYRPDPATDCPRRSDC